MTLARGASPNEIVVRTLGGVVGKVGQRVEGEAAFRPNERAVVFLAQRDLGMVLPSGKIGLAADLDGRTLREAVAMIRERAAEVRHAK